MGSNTQADAALPANDAAAAAAASSEACAPQLDRQQRFWDDLERAVADPCHGSEEAIDDALREFLALASAGKYEFLNSEYDLARCCYKLLDSQLFVANRAYVRLQMIYCLLQEDDVHILHLAAAALLFDGRSNEVVFEIMQDESSFPRLVELIRDHVDDDAGLHRLLIALTYEMSRVRKLSREDLATVDDAFVLMLLQLIEELSQDVDDPYHYPVIRVLLVLNEQYMCFADASSPDAELPLTNRIMKILSAHGPSYRTFGENLILLLNRESALSGQLLILKLLYLLFITPPTFEYFYTNDLHVLVDVIIRNLLDLDDADDYEDDQVWQQEGQRALQHTYLRVLCPLLKNTQISREGNQYKREEVRKLLHLMATRSSAHFAPVDQTVVRLAARCRQIEWIREEGDDKTDPDEPLARTPIQIVVPNTHTLNVAKKALGMSLDEAVVSNLSVLEVSAKMVKEKPSVPAPRRNRRMNSGSSSNGAGVARNGTTYAASKSSPHLSVTETPVSEAGHSPFSDDNIEV